MIIIPLVVNKLQPWSLFLQGPSMPPPTIVSLMVSVVIRRPYASGGSRENNFITEWGVFIVVVMMFRLKITPTTFQRIIMEIFGEYIPTFMQVFLDDFVVYSKRTDHFTHLQLCLEKCRTGRLSLNPAKYTFGVTNGTLLSHIVS